MRTSKVAGLRAVSKSEAVSGHGRFWETAHWNQVVVNELKAADNAKEGKALKPSISLRFMRVVCQVHDSVAGILQSVPISVSV